jgi:hypothetical protein
VTAARLLPVRTRIAATLLALALPLSGRSYSTEFAAAENPLSEGGAWINGAATGVDWCNIQTSRGLAWGVGPCPVAYADPIAMLTGEWGPNQSVQGRARVVSPDPHYYQEIELHLRRTMTAHRATGYEINFGVSHAYVQIVRWNGPLADFTYLGSSCTYPKVCGQVNGFTIRDGDAAKATIAGDTITVEVNGVLVASTKDSTFPAGSPGIGFDYGCASTYSTHGWSSLSATDEARRPKRPGKR